MDQYSNIIIGLDLTDEANTVIERALTLANCDRNKVYLTHCIEPLSFSYGGDLPLDLTDMQKTLEQQAQARLHELAARYGLNKDNTSVQIGMPDKELHRLSSELEADLIVVGSHGRHGLALLLGSTSNAVIKGATCDVLAVRL